MLAEAVCEALDERAMVRWPNDVLVDGRKLAGVLPELRGGQLIAGIGINADATAGAAAGRRPRRRRRRCACSAADRSTAATVLAAVLRAIERRYDGFERDGFTGLERNELAGRTVRLAGGAEGVVDGVDGDGRLVVDGVAHASAEVERVEVSP